MSIGNISSFKTGGPVFRVWHGISFLLFIILFAFYLSIASVKYCQSNVHFSCLLSLSVRRSATVPAFTEPDEVLVEDGGDLLFRGFPPFFVARREISLRVEM